MLYVLSRSCERQEYLKNTFAGLLWGGAISDDQYDANTRVLDKVA